MRVLFLDDMEARHSLFRDIAANHNISVDHAYTAEQAISMLEKGDYDGASLDHDLADEHYSAPYASPSMGGTAHSGRAVARWIAEHGKPHNVAIHSFNPDGSLSMRDTLVANPALTVFRAPFGPASANSWLSWLKTYVGKGRNSDAS